MFIKKVFILIMLLAIIALSGCKSVTHDAAITGVIMHSHRLTLPVGYLITIQVEDTTKSDTPGKTIAEQVIKSQGETLPMPFEVIYDSGKIKANHTYGIRVKIEDSTGNIQYSNYLSVPVITNGNPNHNIVISVDLVNG